MYAADGDLIPDIDYLEVREVGFRDCFVNGFVLLDAPKEVPLCVFARRVLVVRITHANFQCNIGGDGSRVVADGLEEYKSHPFLLRYPSLDKSPVGRTVSRT